MYGKTDHFWQAARNFAAWLTAAHDNACYKSPSWQWLGDHCIAQTTDTLRLLHHTRSGTNRRPHNPSLLICAQHLHSMLLFNKHKLHDSDEVTLMQVKENDVHIPRCNTTVQDTVTVRYLVCGLLGRDVHSEAVTSAAVTVQGSLPVSQSLLGHLVRCICPMRCKAPGVLVCNTSHYSFRQCCSTLGMPYQQAGHP